MVYNKCLLPGTPFLEPAVCHGLALALRSHGLGILVLSLPQDASSTAGIFKTSYDQMMQKWQTADLSDDRQQFYPRDSAQVCLMLGRVVFCVFRPLSVPGPWGLHLCSFHPMYGLQTKHLGLRARWATLC